MKGVRIVYQVMNTKRKISKKNIKSSTSARVKLKLRGQVKVRVKATIRAKPMTRVRVTKLPVKLRKKKKYTRQHDHDCSELTKSNCSSSKFSETHNLKMKGKEHKSVRREGEESRDSNSSHNQEDHVPSFSPKKQFSRRKKEEKTNNIKDKRKDKHKYSDSDSEPNKKKKQT